MKGDHNTMNVEVVFFEHPEPKPEVGDVIMVQDVYYRDPTIFLWIVGRSHEAVYPIEIEKGNHFFYTGMETEKAAKTAEELLDRLKSVIAKKIFTIIKSEDIVMQLLNVRKEEHLVE
jgi:hypothetical protein